MLSYNVFLGLCYLLKLFHIPQGSKTVLPLNSFSSKTAYRNSRLESLSLLTDEKNKCKLIHINAVFRHGSRFSSTKDMQKIEKVHKKITKSENSQELPKSFLEWKSPFPLDKEYELSSVGFEEMMQLGLRFRKRYNEIVGDTGNISRFAVFSTSISRSHLSGAAFLTKFLEGKKTFNEAYSMIEKKHNELRFYDNCPHYTNFVLKNESMKTEYNLFKEGPEIKQVIEDIKKKWNLMDVDLTPEDVRSLYIMCGYEIANNFSAEMSSRSCKISEEKDNLICPKNMKPGGPETSALCLLLEPDHYTVFEYLYDLKHFWMKAYGHKINWLQSCDLMTTILQQIVKAVTEHNLAYTFSKESKKAIEFFLDYTHYNRAVFWFAHAETILPLVSLLNLFNQTQPFTASNFQERLLMIKDPEQRFDTFRVSNIAPFAGNIGLEVFHCPHLMTNDQSGYMITVKSNEKSVKWKLANDEGYVSLEDFKKHLSICSPELYNHFNVCVKPSGS